MMTPKERYLTAIRNEEEPDRVPISNASTAKLRENITGRKYAATKKTIQHVEAGIETKMSDYEALKWNAKLNNDAARKLGTDVFHISDYSLAPKDYEPRYIDKHTFVDWWGKIYRREPKLGLNFWIDGILKNEEDLDKFVPPNPEEINYDIVDFVVKDAKDGDYPVQGRIHLAGMFPYLAMGGIDKFCINLYANPSFVEKVCKMFAKVETKIAKNMIDRGVDIIRESDDFAGSDGPWYPLKTYEKYIFPPIKNMVKICHKHDIPYLKHSDGNIMPILDDLMDFCGIDVIDPIDPLCMNLVEVKKRFGKRICISGTTENTWTVPYGTEEDARKEVRRIIDQGAKGGGFIAGLSNDLPPNCEFEKLLAMIDEAKKYGKYPCGKVEAEG
jgi:uroporphyrinogen decarboxylase